MRAQFLLRSSVPLAHRYVNRIFVLEGRSASGASFKPKRGCRRYVNGVPVEGGLSDPRMAPVDPNQDCASCGGRIKDCQGHFGHLNLARPMCARAGAVNTRVGVHRISKKLKCKENRKVYLCLLGVA